MIDFSSVIWLIKEMIDEAGQSGHTKMGSVQSKTLKQLI